MKNIKDSIKYFILPFLILVVGLLLNFFSYQLHITQINEFVSAPIFNPLLTLIVGSIAYVLYCKQQNDYKSDAAKIILLEIENAERSLKKAAASLKIGTDKVKHELPEKNFVMQTESWSTLRHLFVRDLNQAEWESISDFYNMCHLFDLAVSNNDSFFQMDTEQIRINANRIIFDLVKTSTEKIVEIGESDIKKKNEEIERLAKARKFFEEYFEDPNHFYMYSPIKPLNDAIFYISNMNTNLSLTSIGLKLRKIANL